MIRATLTLAVATVAQLAPAAAMAQSAPAAPVAAPTTASPSQHQSIMPTAPKMREAYERGKVSEAVIDGDRVYISGVVAGLRPGETDVEAAYDRAFKTIANILERAGASWDSVIDITTYHTDVTTNMESFVAVKSRYGKAPFPTWTAIDVDRLIPQNGLVEIKVIARRTAR